MEIDIKKLVNLEWEERAFGWYRASIPDHNQALWLNPRYFTPRLEYAGEVVMKGREVRRLMKQIKVKVKAKEEAKKARVVNEFTELFKRDLMQEIADLQEEINKSLEFTKKFILNPKK